MAAIAQLKAILGIDTNQYKAGMRGAGSSTEQFQSKLASVGRTFAAAFSVGALIAATKKIIDFASQIRHTSDNLEINSEHLQALNASALKYGMTITDQEKMLAKLRQSQGKVIDGDKEYADAVEALNVDIEEFKRADLGQALELIARAYARAEDRAQAFSAVSDLMGRSAKKATAFLKELAEKGLMRIVDEGKRAGNVIEDEIVTKLELAGTRMELLGLKTKVWGADLVGVLATAGEAWNGYARARDKAARNYVGLSEDAKRRAGEAGLLDEEGNPTTPDENSGEETGKLRGVFGALRNKFFFNRMKAFEKLAYLQDKYAELGRREVTSEEDKLRLSIERWKIMEKINQLQSSIARTAAQEAEAKQRALDSVRSTYESSVESLKQRGIVGGASGDTPDELARIGGFVGGSRPGLGMRDRALQLQLEGNRTRKEIEKLTREMNTKLESIESNTTPSGQP